MSDPPPPQPRRQDGSLRELLGLLPEPCAVTDREGRLQDTNAAWGDVFVQTGIGATILEAAAALFRWEPDTWAGIEAELRLLVAGDLDKVTFEAQIAEPPERWAICTIAVLGEARGFIWQLADITRWQLVGAETLRLYQQFRDAVDSISDGFAIYDNDDRLIFCNRRFRELYPKSSAMMVVGRSFEELVRAGALAGEYSEAEGGLEEFIAQRVAIHRALGTSESQLSNGCWIRASDQRTSDGGIVCIHTDITEVRRAEELRRQRDLQDEMLRAQEVLLAELSTPILRISEETIVVPLIGAIDSGRAQRVVESLLEAVAAQRSDVVILDITGVPLVDTQVANVLLQCARAVRLLGTRLVLTGIRPDVAQTIVALGIDLGDIVTRADLREGIRFALRDPSSPRTIR